MISLEQWSLICVCDRHSETKDEKMKPREKSGLVPAPSSISFILLPPFAPYRIVLRVALMAVRQLSAAYVLWRMMPALCAQSAC